MVGTGDPAAFKACPVAVALTAGVPCIRTRCMGMRKFPVVEGPGQVKASEIKLIDPACVFTLEFAVTFELAGAPVPS